MNTAFRQAYQQQYKKEPPQFSAQAFAGVQVFVEALQKVDNKTKVSQQALPQIRDALNQELLVGKYETPLGEIAFTPEGEVVQKEFYVAQIKMEPDGKNGKFSFLKF